MHEHHFVTVVYSATTINKQYTYDPIAKLDVQTQFYEGTGVMKYIPSLVELYLLIQEISNNPNAALILGYHPGAVVDQPYQILRYENFIKPGLVAGTIIQDGCWYQNVLTGERFVARTKDTMAKSIYECFDHDAGMTFDIWCNAMAYILPEFPRTKAFRVMSNSSRMGMLGAENKWHYYWKAKHVDDLINFGQRMLTQTDTPIVDVSVLGQSNRIFYEGMPVFVGGEPTPPVKIEPYFDRPSDVLDTKRVTFNENSQYTFKTTVKEIRQADGSIVRRRVSHNTTVVKDVLKLDTMIAVRHHTGLSITPRMLIDQPELYDELGDATGKIRCQATFDERGSTSWNGILRKGEDGMPLLIDNGSGVKYKLGDNESGMAAGFGGDGNVVQMIQPQPQPQQPDATYYVGYDRRIPTNTLSDTEHAQQFLDFYYGSGLYLIEKEGSYYRWNGKFWEHIREKLLESQFSNAMGADASSAKVTSGLKQVERIAHLQGEMVKEAPPHQITCNNGVFDMIHGYMLPFDLRYFHIHCNEFDYDPNAQCPTLDSIIASQKQDASWARQLDQMMGYCLAGGNNTEHKAMVLDGATRSGKSLIARALVDMLGAFNVSANSLSDITDSKVIANLYGTKLFYDDDCQTPELQHMKNIAGQFKKFLSGSQYNNTQLFTQEMKRGYLNPKMLLLSNGVPEIYDHSGATSARLVVLPFHIGFLGREDTALEGKLKNEYPGILNRWYRGYQDYRQYGFISCEESYATMQEDKETVQPLLGFFNDDNRCTFNVSAKVKLSELATAIETWATTSGHPIRKLPSSKLRKIIKQTLGGVAGVEFKRAIYFGEGDIVAGFIGLQLGKAAFPTTTNVIQADFGKDTEDD